MVSFGCSWQDAEMNVYLPPLPPMPSFPFLFSNCLLQKWKKKRGFEELEFYFRVISRRVFLRNWRSQLQELSLENGCRRFLNHSSNQWQFLLLLWEGKRTPSSVSQSSVDDFQLHIPVWGNGLDSEHFCVTASSVTLCQQRLLEGHCLKARASLPAPSAVFCFSLLLLWGRQWGVCVCWGIYWCSPCDVAQDGQSIGDRSVLILASALPGWHWYTQESCWQWQPDFFFVCPPALHVLRRFPVMVPHGRLCPRLHTSSGALLPSLCSLKSLCLPTPWRVISLSCYCGPTLAVRPGSISTMQWSATIASSVRSLPMPWGGDHPPRFLLPCVLFKACAFLCHS